MVAVDYSIEVPYLIGMNGKSFPGLVVTLADASEPSDAVEVRAELDSGAEFSLIDGEFASAIGLELSAGSEFRFVTLGGATIDSRILQVVLRHADLGAFRIGLRFSTNKIRRNILGRDFFSLIQIGFQERHLMVYLNATP